MIIGHKRQIEYLNQCLANNKIAHAYLFYGPSNVGKTYIAHMFAKAISCQDDKSSIGTECGSCFSCKYISKGIHPDYIVFDDDTEEQSKEISIEQMRDLKKTLSLKSISGRRTVIISKVERLTMPAANAILKLLEEPDKETVIILTSDDYESVLPTISSRTQALHFSLLTDDDMQFLTQKYRDDLDHTQTAYLVQLSAGKPGLLVRLLTNFDFYVKEKKLLEKLQNLKDADPAQTLLFSEHLSKSDQLRQYAVGLLFYSVRKRLLEASSQKEVQNIISSLKKMHKINEWIETTNINTHLALDILFLTARDILASPH